jgi:hypothetical protein
MPYQPQKIKEENGKILVQWLDGTWREESRDQRETRLHLKRMAKIPLASFKTHNSP